LHPNTHSLTRPNSLPFFSAARADLRRGQPLQIGRQFVHADCGRQGDSQIGGREPVEGHHRSGGQDFRRRTEFATSSHRTWISGIRLSDWSSCHKAMVQHADNDAFRSTKARVRTGTSACCAILLSSGRRGVDVLRSSRGGVALPDHVPKPHAIAVLLRRLLQLVLVLLHAVGAR
jgi:hypothetical protein